MISNVPRSHCTQDLFTALNEQFSIATKQLNSNSFVSVIK